MCDTDRCAACQPQQKKSIFWPMVFATVVALADAVWWLTRALWWVTRVALAPGAVALAWCAYVWFTGRTWRHQVRHRYVRRQVRAAGNWAITAVVALLVWKPVTTALVLAVTGIALMAVAVVSQRRELLARRVAILAERRPTGPVEVTAGEPIRDQRPADPAPEPAEVVEPEPAPRPQPTPQPLREPQPEPVGAGR